MATNDYHFISHWRVRSTVEEVSSILGDATDLPRWWPSVYLDVQEIKPGGADGVGRLISLYTKGWLPYTLRWQFRVTEVDAHGFSIEALGDFVGWGVWTFGQDGDWVDIVYDWRISAEKPLLRFLSPVLKPVFSANHRWAMAQGERSLVLEIERRHADSADALARVAPPPGPTFVRRLQGGRGSGEKGGGSISSTRKGAQL